MVRRVLSRSMLLAIGFLVLGSRVAAAEPERSVVQIICFSQQPQWDMPWRFDTVRRATGTGFLIRGKRILTNAHVISWGREILLRRYQDPRPYYARVQFVAHDCDLALLEVEDGAFFEGLEPLDFGPLPKVRSTVLTYGYPAGGDQISYTRGVVSRVEMQTYAHIGNRAFLAVQTDAAINPGNSGGPVLQDDRVVGVSFQGIPGLENAGFFIPPPVIEHFLKDVEDGRYDGFPLAGIRMVPFQNPAYRRFLDMPEGGLAARIDSILPIPETEALLRSDDVLLEAAGYAVGSDGTIMFDGNRVSAGLAFQTVQSGERVPLKLKRSGTTMEISLPVSTYAGDRLLGNQFTLPTYYIYAGLVFTPLSLDYLRTQGREWRELAGGEMVYELFYRRYESPQTARPEPVLLSTVLSAPVTANMKISGRALVDRINGVRIDRLADVVRAFESAPGDYHVLEFFPNRALEVVNRPAAEAASPEILKAFGIAKDRRL